MSGYISREAALNFETSVECKPEQLEAVMEGMAIYGEYLKGLPAADVAPVAHGEWIGDCKAISDADGIARCGMYGFRCSECNGFSIEDGRYCPNCGAKMTGGADG